MMSEHWICRDCRKWFETAPAWTPICCPFCQSQKIESGLTRILKFMGKAQERKTTEEF